MTKRNPDQRLERFNVVLSLEDIAWLDRLGGKVLSATGAEVSRCEGAATATKQETLVFNVL